MLNLLDFFSKDVVSFALNGFTDWKVLQIEARNQTFYLLVGGKEDRNSQTDPQIAHPSSKICQ